MSISFDRRAVLERALDVALAGTIFSGLSDHEELFGLDVSEFRRRSKPAP